MIKMEKIFIVVGSQMMKSEILKSCIVVGTGTFSSLLKPFKLQKLCKSNGFSVAEAMIALLIGSLILGASAPMISKQIKHNYLSDVQYDVLVKKFENAETSNKTKINELLERISELEGKEVKIDKGMIAAFALEDCPTGWEKLSDKYSNADGAFIRNIGGQAKIMGEVQADAAPNITGTFGSLRDWYATSYSGVFSKGSKKDSYNGNDVVSGYMIDFDAQKSSNSYGRDNSIEVRPKNIAFLYCVKD